MLETKMSQCKIVILMKVSSNYEANTQ